MPKRRGHKKKNKNYNLRARRNAFAGLAITEDEISIVCFLCETTETLPKRTTWIPRSFNELGWIVTKGGWYCKECTAALEDLEQKVKQQERENEKVGT